MMDLQISYDSSTAAAPSYLQSAVNYVVSQYDALFTNPIAVKIDLGWGEENGNAVNAGAVADNQSVATYMSYGDLTKALSASATSSADRTAVAQLPSADFTNGGKFYVPLAEQKALGVQALTSGETDGYVGLNSAVSYTFSPNGQIASGTYDIVSVLEHEISEVLGRVDFSGQGSATGTYTPMDLFRYSAPGQRSLTSGSGGFSIDGQTMIQSFGNSQDAADWSPSVVGDVYANVTAGVVSNFSSADLTMMDVLGYNVDPSVVTNTSSTQTAALPAAPAQTAAVPAAATQLSSLAPLIVQPVHSGHVSSQGGNETFVFRPHPGDVTISDFLASGSSHDTLDLGSTSLHSFAAVLQHAQSFQGETVIHLSNTSQIGLVGVTKADLRANPSVFSFHA